MTEKKKMSTADILAAARKNAAAGAAPASKPAAEAAPREAAAEAEVAALPETVPAESAPAESAPAEAAPAKPKSAVAGGAKLSVAEIMAMARANKAAPGAAPANPAAAAKPAAEKPAPKPKADKPAAKPAAAAAAGPAVRDTSSILAAARAAAKPGPVSKSEAAARLKPSAPAKPAKGETVAPPMPAKPEYAKPKAKEAAPQEDRRFFLGVLFGSFLGLGFSTLAATGGLWTLATLRFMFPNVLTEPPSKFKIGFPGDFPPGVVDEKFKAQFGIWPVNVEYKGQRQIVALKTVCTHLGCTPNWLEAEQKFKCPCHGSGFYKDGINFEGPAPRPLERYAIRLADDGQLEVDKSRTFQEELGQWSDAACFVSV